MENSCPSIKDVAIAVLIAIPVIALMSLIAAQTPPGKLDTTNIDKIGKRHTDTVYVNNNRYQTSQPNMFVF